MKRLLLAAAAAVLLSIDLSHVPQALADESGNVEIKLSAPIDATNCTATPPTITVLGLSIDVSNINSDGGGGNGGTPTPGEGGGSDGSGGQGGGCTALTAGQSVELTLSSDMPDANGNLDATQADQGEDSEIKIEAPLQAVDTNNDAVDPNGNVKVLGLLVNISNANMDGLDDDGSPNPTPTATPGTSNLTVGQFVSMSITNNGGQLSATELEVKAFTTGVDVEVDDACSAATPGATPGSSCDDQLDVEVDDTVVVQGTPPPTAGAGGGNAAPRSLRPRKVKKVVTFHLQTGSRHISLAGLPSGRATIKVTRSLNGAQGKRTVGLRKNAVRTVRVRLRH